MRQLGRLARDWLPHPVEIFSCKIQTNMNKYDDKERNITQPTKTKVGKECVRSQDC